MSNTTDKMDAEDRVLERLNVIARNSEQDFERITATISQIEINLNKRLEQVEANLVKRIDQVDRKVDVFIEEFIAIKNRVRELDQKQPPLH